MNTSHANRRTVSATTVPHVSESFQSLVTSRLVLRPITVELAQAIFDDDLSGLRPAEGWPQPGTKNGVKLALERGQPAGWLVVLAGQVIGDCGIHGPVDEMGCVEIGYGLAAPYRGQGYGTEVVSTISNWLLSQSGVVTVRARTQPGNTPSCRALEKAGFRPAGTADAELVYELTA
jgi:RimJ/RimL family protein N-acetyltransferase